MPGCWTPPISWLLGWPGTGFPSQPTSRKATLTSPSAGKAVIASRAQPSFTPTMSPAVFRPFSVIPSSRSLVKFQICLARIFVTLNIVVAVGFMLSGIDDLVVDVFYWVRQLYRKLFVG